MTTRRSAVARGLAFVAGLVGAGAAGRELGRAAAPEAGTQSGSARARRRGRRGARPPAASASRSSPSSSTPRTSGASASSTAPVALRGPGDPDGPANLELHTFELADGTIVGSGTAELAEGTFAVLGGTGRYAGARGTYDVRRPDGEPAEVLVSLLA